jgi:hypothetical protein
VHLYGCNTSTVECLCGVGMAGPSHFATTNFAICCQGPASCSCDNFDTMCESGETEVARCPGGGFCSGGEVQVASCR